MHSFIKYLSLQDMWLKDSRKRTAYVKKSDVTVTTMRYDKLS